MDPSIIKLFEDDEDESMHSGADVDAFTAALNRDIEGDNDPGSGVLSQGSSSVLPQLHGNWQTSSQEKLLGHQIQHQEENQHLQSTEQHSFQMEPVHQTSVAENQQSENSHSDRLQHSVTAPLQLDHNQVKISEQYSCHPSILNRSQLSENQGCIVQQLSNQQPPSADQANRTVSASISINMLIPKLLSLLDKDRSMQLHSLYTKLRTQEITKDNFLRLCKGLVGGQMLIQAVQQVQMQAARQTNQNQHNARINVSSHQPHVPASANQMQSDVNLSSLENNTQKPRERENRSDLQGGHSAQSFSSTLNTVNPERESQKAPIQSVNLQQQQIQVPQPSFPMYGNAGTFHVHAYPRPSVGAVTTSLQAQAQNSQMRQATLTQGKTSTLLGATQSMNMVNVPRSELQNAANETRRLHPGSFSHLGNQQQRPVAWQSTSMPSIDQRSNLFPSMASVKQEAVDQDSEPQQKPQFIVSQGSSIVSGHSDHGNVKPGSGKYERHEIKPKIGFPPPTSAATASQISGSGSMPAVPAAQNCIQVQSSVVIAGSNMAPKKSSIGQKKPLEVLSSSPPHPSKKQKTSGSGVCANQSIEQLNDVTAVSGVNLREEEEYLLSAPKEENQVSEAARRFVEEEEERLIFQKELLQKKLAEIMSRCGIESKSNDVDRCLSICAEERLRGLISNMIRLSKQRLNVEKTRHRYVVTSDVQRQILMMNKKAKDEWEKKQAEEADKLRKLNEVDENTGADGDKDKDEGRSRTNKNKEEDDILRTTAANVAARAAVGGDDMLAKWQVMAEQARQKRDAVVDGTADYQQGRSASGKTSTTSFDGTSREPREAGKRSHSAASLAGGTRTRARRSGAMSCPEAERVISTKDLIAILEREPQMSKSTIVYRLYEKMAQKSAME